MAKLMDRIFEKAVERKKRIVLAEGEGERVIRAASDIVKRGIAQITLVGDPEKVRKNADGIDLTDIKIINPETSVKFEEYAALLYELRKSKGMTMEDAKKLTTNRQYFATLMLKAGDADGLVSGSETSTGDVLRPGLQIIKAKPGISCISSCFLMLLPENSAYGENGVMIFGDCAVNINPNAKELAEIAIASVDTAKKIADIANPKVAMLSFSTKGSAKHEYADKVIEATKIFKEKQPKIAVDGELQVDAALVPSVSQLKAPGSAIGGKANILIFPDLQAGNIGYKLVQRLAGAEAIGPICQGFAKPINDLSRGCSWQDIVAVVAMTSLQAD